MLMTSLGDNIAGAQQREGMWDTKIGFKQLVFYSRFNFKYLDSKKRENRDKSHKKTNMTCSLTTLQRNSVIYESLVQVFIIELLKRQTVECMTCCFMIRIRPDASQQHIQELKHTTDF